MYQAEGIINLIVMSESSARSLEISTSPFVVGRPLRAEEPIFGRDTAFRFIAGELQKFSSVNLVGERRMGKTSVLNHLIRRQDLYLPFKHELNPIHLARIDLQDVVPDADSFYGITLRELLATLEHQSSVLGRELIKLQGQLERKARLDHDQFRQALVRLRELKIRPIRPVILVDEFEHLLDSSVKEGFPYPDFFNHIRSLITAELIALVVASRRPLAEYFTDPNRPNTLTSSFPTYLQPFTLSLLDSKAADALLLQECKYPLTLEDAAEARQWARGNPCHLQVAGAAWYQAKAEGHHKKWVYQRREELKAHNCLVNTAGQPQVQVRQQPTGKKRTLWLILKAIFWGGPVRVGRLAQLLGKKFDDIAAWLIGIVLILVIILSICGVARRGEVTSVLKKVLGIPSGAE